MRPHDTAGNVDGPQAPDLAWQLKTLRRFLLSIDARVRLSVLAAAGLDPDKTEPATPARLSRLQRAIAAAGLAARAAEHVAACRRERERVLRRRAPYVQ